MLNGDENESCLVHEDNKITRDKENTKIVNKRVSKKYNFNYDKRVIKDNFITYPYGY